MKRFVTFLTCSLFISSWIAWSFLPRKATDTFEVWMLDVGQGESVLLQEPTGKKILFDGGPDDSVLGQLGSILPAWDRTINLMILSHPHSDHLRGLISVIDRYTVQEFWSSGTIQTTSDFQALSETLATHHIRTRTVAAGEQEQFGDIHLTVYHPIKPMAGKDPPETHDGDVVVKAVYGDMSILLAGDLHEGHEAAMLHACSAPCTLQSTVLQIPHHGSASGLSEEFLNAVHPQLAIIPVGLQNKFRHPRKEILEKLNKAEVPVFRTDFDHVIHISFTRSDGTASTDTRKTLTLAPVAQTVPP